MKAIQFDNFGEPSVLKSVEIVKPEILSHEALIKVRQIGINYHETLQRQGTYPGPSLTLPAVLGSEVVGTIEELGKGVKTIQIGSRVAVPLFAVQPTGGYAEYVKIPANLLVSIPDSISDEQALSTMLQGLVAYFLLKENSVQGKVVLVTAAAGGIGSLLVELAKIQGASKVIGIVGSDEKIKYLKTKGIDYGLNYKAKDWTQSLSEISDSSPIDVIFDSVGGDIAQTILQKLNTFGTFVSYGAASGVLPELNVNDINRFIFLSQTFKGFALFNFLNEISIKEGLTYLFKLIEEGKLKPTVDHIYQFDDMVNVHTLLEQNKTVGKVIVSI